MSKAVYVLRLIRFNYLDIEAHYNDYYEEVCDQVITYYLEIIYDS